MCVVIDMDRMSSVFNENNRAHAPFKDLRVWILKGPGFIVFGGTRYNKELKEGNISLIGQLKDYRKSSVLELRTGLVDHKQEDIYNDFPEVFRRNRTKDDGDPHIVAICKVSETRIVCTNDGKCMNAIERVFTKNRPKNYSKADHKHLLIPDNVIKIPASKIKN